MYISIIHHETINQRFSSNDLWESDPENINAKNKYLEIPELITEDSVRTIILEINELTEKYFNRPLTTVSAQFLGAGLCGTLYYYKTDCDKYRDPVTMEQVLEKCYEGDLEFCEKYLPEIKKYDYATCHCAKGGHLKCLKFLLENGCRLGCQFTRSLFSSDNMEIIKWCYENKYIKKCPYSKKACGYWNLCSDAAYCGNLDAFIYLYGNGEEIEEGIISECSKNLNIAKWIVENNVQYSQDSIDKLMESCIHSWNVINIEKTKEIIEWCLKNGGTWKSSYMNYYYTSSLNVEFCEYIFKSGCPLERDRYQGILYELIGSKKFEMSDWFIEKGCTYNTEQFMELYKDDKIIISYLKNKPKMDGDKIHFVRLKCN